jgi:hypothetical protein
MGSVAPNQRPNPTKTLAVAPDGKSFLIQSPQSSIVLPKGYMILVQTMQCNSGEEEKP